MVPLTLLALLPTQAKGKLRMNQMRILFRDLTDVAFPRISRGSS